MNARFRGKADMPFCVHMSAIGPKRTSLVAPHMSAFGGKADMTIWACLLLRSLLGAKRTCGFALHMSAFDPKRAWHAFPILLLRPLGMGVRRHPLWPPPDAEPT